MSSSLDFVQYVCEQGRDAGTITSKRMFGEFGIYCDLKFFGLICDDQFFVKFTKEVMEVYPSSKLVAPYPGSKDYILVSDLDDKETVSTIITLTCDALPAPKPRKTK